MRCGEASVKARSSAGLSAVIQRAPVYWQVSRGLSASYSAFSRCCTTSNCNWPTPPTTILPPQVGAAFGLQPVLHHLELQLAHGAEQHVAAGIGPEDLYRALFAQLGQ